MSNHHWCIIEAFSAAETLGLSRSTISTVRLHAQERDQRDQVGACGTKKCDCAQGGPADRQMASILASKTSPGPVASLLQRCRYLCFREREVFEGNSGGIDVANSTPLRIPHVVVDTRADKLAETLA